MKKLATILVVATLGSISFEVSMVAAEKSRKLSGSQIREKFAVCSLLMRCIGVTYTTETAH
jgi:hypothetical protein